MISSNFGSKTHFSFWINLVGFQQKKSAKVGEEVKRFRSAWGRFCVRNRPRSKNFRLSVHFSTVSVTSILTWYPYKSLQWYLTEHLIRTFYPPQSYFRNLTTCTYRFVFAFLPFFLGLICKSIERTLWCKHWHLPFFSAEQSEMKNCSNIPVQRLCGSWTWTVQEHELE